MTRAKVLVVEDDKVFARLTQGSLMDFGYNVLKIVATGEAAIQTAGELAPDIVLMDISLQGAMDGIEAAEEIYHRYDIPVVYLTAAVNDSLFQPANQKHHFCYLVKPFDKNQLYAEIETALLKHKAHQESRKSRKWLSSALKGIADAVIATDTAGLINIMNPSAEKLTGWSLEEAISQSLAKVLKVSSDSAKSKSAQLFLETQEEALLHIEFELATKSGQVPVDCYSNKLYNDKGEIVGTIYVLRDITERNRAEKALKESEQRFKDIADSMADWIWEVDENAVYTYCSDRVKNILGYSPDEVIGKSPLDLMIPDEAKRVGEILSKIVKNREPIKDLENWNVSKNGKLICLLTNGVPIFDEKGHLKGYHGVDKDITERKQAEKDLKESEEKMRAILNAPSDLMALIDSSGVVQSANTAFAEALNTRIENVMGKCLYDFLTPDVAAFRKTKIDKVFHTGKPTFYVDESAGGQVFNIQNYPVYSADGKVTAVAVYARDMTELLIAQENNSRLGRIVDESLNEIYIFDAKTLHFLQVNRGARENLRYTMEELRSLTPLDLEPEFTAETFAELVRPLLKEEKNRLQFSTKQRRKDGTLYSAEVHLQLTNFRNSRSFVAFILDISERERAEEQIQQLTQAVEQSPASIVITDADGNIEYVNKKFEQITGYSLIEMIGQNPRILKSGEQSQKFYQELWETILAGKEWHGQFHNKKKNGDLLWEQETISSIKSKDGRITHFLAVKEDITRRKEAEEKLAREQFLMHTFVDNVPDAIYFKDRESRFIRINKAQATRLSLKDPSDVVGKTDFDFFAKKDARKTFKDEQNVMKTGKISIKERKESFKDGQSTWVLSTQVPMKDKDGKISGIFGFSKDITDRKRAEEALQEKEALLRATLEATGDGILVVNKKWKVTLANARFAEMWRIPEEIIRTKDDNKLLHFILDQLVEPQEFLKRVKELYNKPEQAFDTIHFKDGRVFERFSRPLMIEEKMSGRVWSFRDITERVRAENALKDSEALYESLIESMPLNAFRKDLEGKFVFANARFCDKLERPLKEIIGKTDFDFSPVELAKKYRNDDKKVIENDQIFEDVEKNQTPNGEQLFVHVIKSPVKDPNGQIIGLQGIFWDVTEQEKFAQALRESEEKFKSISESAKDAIIMIDSHSDITFWNKAAKKIFGYSSNEVMGKNLYSIITPVRYYKAHKKAFTKFQKTGKGAAIGKTVELEALRRDGSEFPVDISLAHLKLHGKWHAVGIIRDISERKVLEAQLLQSQKLESIGQLAAGIAHEINTPTQYIGDNTNFLKDSFADVSKLLTKYQALLKAAENGGVREKLIEEIETAREEADIDYLLEEIPASISQTLEGIKRVTKIVRAMKDFSHPGIEGKTAIDLNRAIESTITVARNEWKYVADVETHFDDQLPLVPCMPDQINQVVLNMIINATHAISDVIGEHADTKGKITVSTKLNDDYAEIRIGDNGTGIPEHARPKIFDPFFTTKEVGKGTGQGLAIAHDIVVGKHGGNISFETETGKGTTFIIRLPIIDAQAS